MAAPKDLLLIGSGFCILASKSVLWSFVEMCEDFCCPEKIGRRGKVVRVLRAEGVPALHID